MYIVPTTEQERKNWKETCGIVHAEKDFGATTEEEKEAIAQFLFCSFLLNERMGPARASKVIMAAAMVSMLEAK